MLGNYLVKFRIKNNCFEYTVKDCENIGRIAGEIRDLIDRVLVIEEIKRLDD